MLFRLIICNQNKNLFKRLLINSEINKTNNSLNLIKSFTTFQNSNNNKLIKLINNLLIKEELIQSNRQLFKRNSSSIIKGLIKENYTKRQSIVLSIIKRNLSSLKDFQNRGLKSRNKNVVLYSTAFVLTVLGLTYAAVPLYRIYCQSTGKGGKPFIDEKAIQKIVKMVKNEERLITVTFSAETTSQMAWNFKPTQHEIRCSPGETVLAFFTAKNPLDVAVNGL
jgi:maltooligosyltrehalose synthase